MTWREWLFLPFVVATWLLVLPMALWQEFHAER